MTAIHLPAAQRRSFAQNREDLVLAGFLKHVDRGFYVDVGANHPVHDSVTMLFYDRGWSGINVEPNPALHALLSTSRTRDINLCVGVGAAPGTMTFRRFNEVNGLSSFSRGAQQQVVRDHPRAAYHDAQVEVVTLADVLGTHHPAGDVHFAKIDVEGLELEVLLGNDWQRFRPWVACIERNLHHDRQMAIDAFMAAQRYLRAFHDGINDFWLAAEHGELQQHFSYAGDVVMPPASAEALQPTPNLQLDELMQLEGAAFVGAAYTSVLQRQADPAGYAHYLTALEQGALEKVAVIQALASSEEAQARELGTHWLQQIPVEAPSKPALRPWLRRLLAR